MIKYFHFARISFGDHLKNRLRAFTRFLIFMLLAWVMIQMWRVIYANGHTPDGISLTDMSWYIGLSQLMVFLSPRIFVTIDDDVRSGNIGYFLNRPMPYLWMRFSEGFGALCGNILIYFIFGIPFLYLLIGNVPDCGTSVLLPIMALLLSASVLHLLFQIGCGLSTFWTNDAVFIYHSYQKVMILLGGMYAPISLYPDFFFPQILKFLPFAAMVGNNAGFLLPNTGDSFIELFLLQLFWIAIIVVALSGLYQICLKKVEVNGG
ncbi:MAG TPA: hypothetical protein PLE43_07930 [Alphaproteobacteria bacterium]|nr:hypothetical protein [Alphaproteobacteria bacterium]